MQDLGIIVTIFFFFFFIIIISKNAAHLIKQLFLVEPIVAWSVPVAKDYWAVKYI